MTAHIVGIAGCAAAVGLIAFKIIQTPPSDEPSDPLSEPFGDIPHIVLSDRGGWMDTVHEEGE